PSHPVIVQAPQPPSLPAPEPAVRTPAPPAPRPHRPGQEKAPPLDQKKLETVVNAAHPRLTACLRRYSADLPAIEGKIIIEVTVASSGKVSAARTMMPEIHSSGLAACLASEATRLHFPRHA